MKCKTEKQKCIMDVYHALGALHDEAVDDYRRWPSLKDAMIRTMEGVQKMNTLEITALKEILDAYFIAMR